MSTAVNAAMRRILEVRRRAAATGSSAARRKRPRA